jgi:predicted nucleic acid-binding protein
VILLDTNVISELMRSSPSETVLAWLDAQRDDDCFLCAPVVAELRYGVAILPEGRRRRALATSLDRIENEEFGDRILPFDRGAARRSAEIRAKRKALGKPMSATDAAIAAIASVHAMTLATRNVRDFEGLELALVDPFST